MYSFKFFKIFHFPCRNFINSLKGEKYLFSTIANEATFKMGFIDNYILSLKSHNISKVLIGCLDSDLYTYLR